MSQLDMNNKRNKLAYLLSLFMVVTPQLAHSQSLLAQTTPETKHAVHDHSHGTATYVCPMHPDETSHEAGSRCSICNMFLVEAEEEEEKGSHDDHLAVEQKTYVCPMHPDETSHEAGSRCSICNMFLVEDEEEEEKGGMDHSGHDMSAMPTDEHAGHSHQAANTPADTVFNAAEPASLNDGGSIKYVCPMHAHIISEIGRAHV